MAGAPLEGKGQPHRPRPVPAASGSDVSSPDGDDPGPRESRTPPQDMAAEQSVLGGMLLSKDVIADVIEILRSTDFYRPNHATIFDIIVDLFGAGEPADAVTVAAALQTAGDLTRIGGATYLHDLIQRVPTAANASYYARIVAERAVLRRLVEAGTRIAHMAYQGGRDVDDLVDLAQQAVYDVTGRRTSEDFASLADLLQPAMDEIESAGGRPEGIMGVPTGFNDLDRLLNGLHPGQLIIMAGRPGLGKALALDTPLPTPDGWTTMGQVQIGDRLMGADGMPAAVTATSEVMHARPCYEVKFSDGAVIVADGEHRWVTHTRFSRRYGKSPMIHTTAEIATTVRCETADHRLNHSIAVAAPLGLPARNLPVAPYTLGVWLGDGHSAAARFTTADPEIVTYVEADGYVAPPNGGLAYAIKHPPLAPLTARACMVCGSSFTPRSPTARTCGRACGGGSYHKLGPMPEHRCESCGGSVAGRSVAARRCASCHARQSVTVTLREIGVLGAKHIPSVYLRASEAQRRALLAGLLDTDGTVAPTGNVQFCVTSRRLAADVRELITSLGYRCSMTTKAVKGRTDESSTAYTINFSTADDVFRLERKRLAHKERRRTRDDTNRSGLRYIVEVRPVPSVPVRCVTVDNEDHLFLAGDSMIPTHNSTAAMDFARSASVRHNMTSAIFSLEMSKIEIVTRMLAAEARVPLHVLRSGRLSDEDWTRLARRMGEISEAPLFVDDTPNMTLMEIRAKARRLKQRNNLRLVVVDYLQLMTSPKRVESRQQEVADLSRGLKLLAKEIECPVVAVSQLNRGPEQRTDKRPQLSDLRESGSIEQDADIVILLHRDDYYDKETPRAGEADFIVAKHRNGPTDTITVAAQLHFSRFVDMAII